VGDEGLNGFRVELMSGLLSQHIKRLVMCESFTVGTRGGDRVKRIGHGDDPCARWDLITG
jgi:hypothetical protein